MDWAKVIQDLDRSADRNAREAHRLAGKPMDEATAQLASALIASAQTERDLIEAFLAGIGRQNG